ncbi:hypothetical protein [Clostridium estertheticum]|uniref:hypothetical protein n=1 Tax=Clostridium estertheticum TaxID=238834 RepID=UPI001C0B1DE7|nr:hypothetical protein [Clostridium estertheticum]MBU3183250.1 hypothetical protein [Clostridium estertheticum]
MKEIKVQDKIKVFVSSRCGQQNYDTVRTKVKSLIEGTTLATVYLFEDGTASTQSAQQEYLYAVDDSDICLFLIDNADGVSDAVLREINRAKGQEKKSLYLFCKERQKKATQIQNELMGAKGARYSEINRFDDFILKGYTSLINDITTVYKNYCKGRLADREFENNTLSIIEMEAVASESLDKQLLKGIDQSKEYMSSFIFKHSREKNETSKLDISCKEFLQVLLGDKQIREFNTSLLLEELKNKQSKSLYQVVEFRWMAIQSYFSNDLKSSRQYMQQALESAYTNLLPKWFINDILIDLRNLNIVENVIENRYTLASKEQIELDKSNEVLFYPVLDRLEKEYNQKLIEQNFKNKTESHYITHFGNNIDSYTDLITNVFVVALFNGSLTQILRTIDRLKSMAFSLCEQYGDWKFRILLLKLSMINGGSKDNDRIISTFNEILGKMNATDAISIYEMASSIPLLHKKLITKFEIFKQLGYYFSDNDYHKISKELIEEINKWIYDDNKIINLGDYIFKLFQSNYLRLDNTEIVNVCCKIFQTKCRRWYNNVFKLIAFMGIINVNDEIVKELISEFIKIINNDEEKNNCYELEGAIISVCKSNTNLTKELGQIVSEKMPKFYSTTYSLEVLTHTIEGSGMHIQRYLEDIRKQNETQGLNGVYLGYTDNPYLIIINIIRNNNLDLDCRLTNDIEIVIMDTLLSPKQTVTAKINAIQLLIFLKNFKFKANYDFNKVVNDLVENEEIVEMGFVDAYLEKRSKLSLKFNFLLLKLCFGAVSDEQVLGIISVYSNQDDSEKIESLKAITNLMDNNYSNIIDERKLYIFVQYVLGFCSTKSHDIRFNAVKALLKICTQKTSKVIMTQLSKIMDIDSAPIKFLILNDISNLTQYNEEIAALILQKAKVDNHFLVRAKALKILSI